jgi:hypothetical protein
VVVILMGAAGDGAAIIAHSLASEVGWQVVEWPEPRALGAIVASTLGRRQHLILSSNPLTPGDQEQIRGDLHGVRFVDLGAQHGTPDDIIRAIRQEFGI